MTATLTGPVQILRSSSQMTRCLLRVFVNLWKMWWIRAVLGVFQERKMNVFCLLLVQQWLKQHLLGMGGKTWCVLELAVLKFAFLLAMAKLVLFFWLLQQCFVHFHQELVNLSKQKELYEPYAPSGNCSPGITVARKCISMICKVNFCSLLSTLFHSKAIVLPYIIAYIVRSLLWGAC